MKYPKPFRLLVSISVSALAGCVSIPEGHVELAPKDAKTGFVPFTVRKDDKTQPAVVYVPPGYDPDKNWPLIVYLHGSLERGSDGKDHLQVGLPTKIVEHPEWFPCLVLMPQCPKLIRWSDRDGRPSLGKGDASWVIDEALRHVLENYNVDEGRISLTGISMGGYGVFQYGATRIERFSCLMPIAGGGIQEDAGELAQRPMWVFHGNRDPFVWISQSRKMVSAIRSAGGEVRYTEYDKTGHAGSWRKAYDDPATVQWLLAHERR